jgi:hypothetical protein
MKPNFSLPTVFPSALFALMVALALIAGFVSYGIGREALKGINQLDMQLTKKARAAKAAAQAGQSVLLLKEGDVIAKVKSRINGDIKAGKTKPVQEKSKKSEKKS